MAEPTNDEQSGVGSASGQVARCPLDSRPKASKFSFGFVSLNALASLIQARGQSLELLHKDQNERLAALLSLNETDFLHLQVTNTIPQQNNYKVPSEHTEAISRMLVSPIGEPVTSTDSMSFNWTLIEQNGLIVCRAANALGWQPDFSWCPSTLVWSSQDACEYK